MAARGSWAISFDVQDAYHMISIRKDHRRYMTFAHSLRKGAATGSFSIDVAILRICHMGGWKVRAATYVDYIDPTCPPSPAAHRFFGWLRPA